MIKPENELSVYYIIMCDGIRNLSNSFPFCISKYKFSAF